MPISNIKLNDNFSIMIEKPLSEYDRKTLTALYLPIVGHRAINLLTYFYSLILSGEHESHVESYDKIVRDNECRLDEIIESLTLLEGIGLIDTYAKDNLSVYFLKEVLTPMNFLACEELSQTLISAITVEEFNKLALEFLVRRIDINKLEKVTKSFDEVFESSEELNHLDLSTLIIKTSNGVVIKNEHFDYKHFSIFISALGILSEEKLNDKKLYEFINRYSFLYQLSVEEMRDAMLRSGSINNGEIDYEMFKQNIKFVYGKKEQPVKVVKKKLDQGQNDKIINFFETASPNEIVEKKYGDSMTPSEVEIFDRLISESGVSVGVINVALNYVLEEKNGEIPTYNYFLKIIKTWKRAGITNAKEAIEYINRAETKHSYSKPSKTKKEVPSWYDDYLKSANEKLENSNSAEDSIDLEDFFKTK